MPLWPTTPNLRTKEHLVPIWPSEFRLEEINEAFGNLSRDPYISTAGTGTLQPIWDSEVEPNDRLGASTKFAPPLVANGSVYQATYDNQVVVYGLGNPSLTPTRDISLLQVCKNLGAGKFFQTAQDCGTVSAGGNFVQMCKNTTGTCCSPVNGDRCQ